MQYSSRRSSQILTSSQAVPRDAYARAVLALLDEIRGEGGDEVDQLEADVLAPHRLLEAVVDRWPLRRAASEASRVRNE